MFSVPEALPDGMRVLGGLILLYPALRVSRLTRLYYKFDQVEIEAFPSESLNKYVAERKNKIFMRQFEWNLIDQVALFFGLSLVIMGDLTGFLHHLVSFPVFN